MEKRINRKYWIFLIIMIIMIGCIFYDIRYIGLTKYNIYPQKAIEDYLSKMYQKSVVFLSRDFYKDHDVCIWSYQCKDEDGHIFNMGYEFYRERPETGWATVFHTENLEEGVKDFSQQ